MGKDYSDYGCSNDGGCYAMEILISNCIASWDGMGPHYTILTSPCTVAEVHLEDTQHARTHHHIIQLG